MKLGAEHGTDGATANVAANDLMYMQYLRGLDELRAMSGDFTDGSQQRWMLKMREVNALRDRLWYLQYNEGTR